MTKAENSRVAQSNEPSADRIAADLAITSPGAGNERASTLLGGGVTPASSFRLLDLFSGIGGFSLGLERTGGFKTVAFCEIEEFPRRVLAKHWPEVPCYHDIRELTADRLSADGIAIDAICGGFPCQDISIAGKGAGITGSKSGLWSEYARIIGELGPQVVIVENGAELLSRGLGVVLGDLAALGYDAEWHCIPASTIGSPQHRDRLWIVAYRPASGRNMANAMQSHAIRAPHAGVAFSTNEGGPWIHEGWLAPLAKGWAPEPALDRVVDGLPASVDRENGAYGNAVVPQIPELIGNAILAAHRATSMERAA